MQLKIKKLDPNAKLPIRGSEHAAGWDLYALNAEKIYPGKTKKIETGLAIEIPEGYFGAIYARSGLATKKGLRPANCVGVIDSDYRGPIIVALRNDHMNNVESFEEGERIAQLVIQKYEDLDIVEVDELSDTSRGEGGFGSTGEK